MIRHLVIWTTIAIAVLAALLFVVPLFFPWSPINCRYQDVDIMTGRLRFTQYLLFCKVSERIEDSPLSKALPPDMVATAKPDWQRVNTFSPGVHHSPHYIFHGAIGQIRMLGGIWEISKQYGLTDDLKQKTALHVLALWQHSGSYPLADDYINGLHDLTEESKRQNILKALPKLQMPLVETNGSQVTRTMFFPNGQAMDRIHGYLDPLGHFIRHGVWERWWPDGTRLLYGHFEDGEHHGRRFEWDRDGKLIVIEAFNRGQLSEYVSDNLEQHPDYKIAQQLLSRNGLTPLP
jgi:hypothetical protein